MRLPSPGQALGRFAGSLVAGYRKAAGANSVHPWLWQEWQRAHGVSADRGMQSDMQRYATSDDIYAVVNRLSDAAATIPFRVLQDGEEAVDSDLAALLRNPNAWFGGYDFWRRVYSWVWLTGECFLVVERNNPYDGDLPNRLWPLSGERMQVYPGTDRVVDHYEVVPPGGAQGSGLRLEPEDVVPLTLWNPGDMLRGMSPLSSLRMGLESERQAKSSNLDIFRNGMMPDSLLTITGASAEQMKANREAWQSQHSAEGRRHGMAVLVGEAQVQRLQLSPEDAQFLELDRMTTGDVAKAYGVPPMMIGVLEDATFSNYQTAWGAFYHHGVLPCVRMLAGKLSAHLSRQFGDGLSVDMDLSEVVPLQADIKAQADTIGVLVRSGYDRLWVAQTIMGDEVPPEAIAEELPVVLRPIEEGDAPVAVPPAQLAISSATARKAARADRGDRVRASIAAMRADLAPTHLRAVESALTAQAEVALGVLPSIWPAKALGDEIVSAIWAAVLAAYEEHQKFYTALQATLAAGYEGGGAGAIRLYQTMRPSAPAPETAVRWAAAEAAEKVKWIDDSTIRAMRAGLTSALEEGGGIEAARQAVRHAFLGGVDPLQVAAYPDRVENIVQTELASAFNAGHAAAFADSGVAWQQWWYSGLADSRHGPDRELGHGQLRRPGESFHVGQNGSAARYPADPSLPVGQRVRCKCVLLAIDDEDGAEILAEQGGA